jgi:hypothetical protein
MLTRRSVAFHIARQPSIRQAPSDNRRNCTQETLGIGRFTLVKPKCLLVAIPEKMERLDVHIRPFERPLEQALEILQSIGVHISARVAFQMIDDLPGPNRDAGRHTT